MTNWFDLTVGILLLLTVINGYRKGLIMQLAGLAILILSAIFGGRIAEMILPRLTGWINLSPEAARVLSFILAFAAIATVLTLTGRLLQKFIDVVLLSFVNRLAGAVIAAGTMMLFLSILLNLVLLLDRNESVIRSGIKQNSFFYERVEAVVPAIIPHLNSRFWDEYVPEKYREEMEKKSDNLYQSLPEANPVDSSYQKRYFDVN
ncbi:MAG: CvpA family protein [bacterium]|jgi:membrane protein required for colicin V production|nr:CvpA family protein [bacterium]MDD3624410.1 CvpA family protein [Proteiniphilum sp.]MDD3967402.1 CvpA family protein [Proteiniphilum sp.]MDD4458350.1 CvpA family protein [Proteiniphilum sp.]